MKFLISIQVFLFSVYSICCIEALNESVLTIDANDSSLTTASNGRALNSLLTNISNSSITTIANSQNSSLAIPSNITSDRHLSDPLSEQFVKNNKSEENNSQENFSSKNCFESVCNENAPKVLVTQKSRTSISIAFDDFKLPNYESGYVVQYKQQNLNLSDWSQIQANNTPFVTIKDLRPHTPYLIQVLVWEDIDSKKLGLGSEIISVLTEDGCFVNNTVYSVGQQFFEGCDRRCICRPNAQQECFPRFHLSLISMKTFFKTYLKMNLFLNNVIFNHYTNQ